MWKLVTPEEKAVNIAFAWKLKVFMPVDSCKLCVKSLNTPVSKTFNIIAVHSYRCKVVLSSRLGGKMLVLHGFQKLLQSRFINLTCVCLR